MLKARFLALEVLNNVQNEHGDLFFQESLLRAAIHTIRQDLSPPQSIMDASEYVTALPPVQQRLHVSQGIGTNNNGGGGASHTSSIVHHNQEPQNSHRSSTTTGLNAATLSRLKHTRLFALLAHLTMYVGG